MLCEMWSAHKALFLGLVNQIVPVSRVDGQWIPNPLVVTDRFLDAFGNIVYGDFKTGRRAPRRRRRCWPRATTDLAQLDEAVEALCTRLLMLMPDCVSKTVNGLRKHKQWHWDNTSVTNREWLALNMMTEAKRRVPRLQRGAQGAAARWTSSSCASCSPRGTRGTTS